MDQNCNMTNKTNTIPPSHVCDDMYYRCPIFKPKRTISQSSQNRLNLAPISEISEGKEHSTNSQTTDNN